MARTSYNFIDLGADEARGYRQPRPCDIYSDSLARRRQLIEAQSYSYIDRIPLPKQQYRYLDIKSDELRGTFKSDVESEQRLLYYGQLDRMRHISLEPSAPQVTHHRQARPWEVIPGQGPGEEAPPRTPTDQPIRGYEPRAPAPPGRPPPYPGAPAARRALRGTHLPEHEQPVRPQRTPPSSPVEDIVDDGQFQFSPPTSRRQLFSGTSGQQRARLGRETDVSPDFEFPAQPANADPHLQGEFAVPPVARETEFEAPPVSAPANQAEYEVPPTRTAMPAYHRGPSYASEVDNLAEPQVLREDTILTPVAEGRYKRQRVTDGFSGSRGGSPGVAAAGPIHPSAGMMPARDVTLLYSWIDPRSEEFAIDITKGKNPTGHVTSTLPPVAPRTVVRRYIDAPMLDVARPGNEAPVLAPHEPLEERAAAARERHALHQAEEEVQVRLQEVDGRVSVAFTAPGPAVPETSEVPVMRPSVVPAVSGAPHVPAAAIGARTPPTRARSESRRVFSVLPFITPGGTGDDLPPQPQPPPQPVDSVNRQSRWKRMFSRKPKERKVPEVNVLPTPVLVPPEEGPEPSSPEVPHPAAEEVPAEDVPPTGVTTQEALPGTTRVITAQRMPPQPAPQVITTQHLPPQPAPQVITVGGPQNRPAPGAVLKVQPAPPPGDVQAGTGAAPLDISRMGGPQRAERGGAALMSAAERATAPQPAPVAFQEEVTEVPRQAEGQSRAAPSPGVVVIGPAEGFAPVSHPPLGPGAAAAARQLPTFEPEDSREAAQRGREFDAPNVDIPRGRPRERIIIHPPAHDESFPAQGGPAGVSQYEDQEEADEGGQEVEVQEEVWAPAEPSGRDASPSRLELQKQGVPGYANQESFKTAREGRIGGDAPAPGEPFEHATAIEELAQAPPRAKPAGTLEAPEALPQEVGVHESQQRDTDAEQGPGEWPDVTLAEHVGGDAGGADTRGQATQTAYPEQPRTPPATSAQQAATSAAGAGAQRPPALTPEARRGDPGHMVAGQAPGEPAPIPQGELGPASRGQSAWAIPAAVQPGVPHVPPADSSDEEPEAEQDTQAAELSQEQQQSQAQLTGHGAQGTIPKQEAAGEEAMEEAGRERLQDLDRQLRENAEQLQRSAASQTGVGIASTAFGPLAVAASAQGDRPGSRAAAERRPVQGQHTGVPATQLEAADAARPAEAGKTARGVPSDGAAPGGTPGGAAGRIVIIPAPDSSAGVGGVPPEPPATGAPSHASFPIRSTAGTGRLVTRPGGGEEYELREEHFYSPEEGYSTPPEDFAAGSPQSFTSEAGSSQYAESPWAVSGRGEGEPPGGSYRAETQLTAPRRAEGGPLGGSYQAKNQPLVLERSQGGEVGRAAEPGEAAAGPALASTEQGLGTALSAPGIPQGRGEPESPRGALLRRDTPSPSAFQRFRVISFPREHPKEGIPEHEGEHDVGELGQRASPEEPWPGMSAEAAQGVSDDSATWRADQATLQRALDQAIAQPIDPSRRPMWTDTSGVSETQGADVAFYDASEGQEQALHEPRPASEAPPVAQVTPPAPPSTPVVSPALSAAQIAPETPTRARLPEMPEEEMAPGRWHGASIRAPRRSKSREELKQVIAGISSQKSEGEEAAPVQAPVPPDPDVQAAEEERMRIEDEERREWESAQGAGPRAEGLQRQISFEERRGRERLADLAESTRRSMTEQQQRLEQIAGQGMTRIQQTRGEGVGKITAVRQAAVPGQAMTELWPGTDLPTAEEARQEWERRIAQSPTIPTGTAPTVKSELGPEVRISQPAVRYSVPSGRAAAEQGAASTQGARTAASPFTKESTYAPVSRSQDDSEPLRPAASLKGKSRSSSLPGATSLEYPSKSIDPGKPLTAEEKGKAPAPSFMEDPGPSQIEWEGPEGASSAQSAQTQHAAPQQAASTGDSTGLPVKTEPVERKETLSKRVKAIFQGGRRSGPPVKE